MLLVHLRFTCLAQAKGENACVAAGGQCVMLRDGYYQLSYVMIAIGICLGLWYRRLLPRLEALPLESWRAHKARKR